MGFKCSDVDKFEKLNSLSISIFELSFYQNQNNWKQKILPIEINKNNSDRVVDLLFYKNLFILLKKLYIF